MSFVINLIHSVAAIGFFTTLFFNIVLIFLTHFRVKRDFGAFKWLLTIFALSGCFFASVEFFVPPVLHIHNAGYAFFCVRQLISAPVWVINIFISLYIGCYAATISFLAVQFIYRYVAIFSPHKLSIFDGWKLALWICYPIFFGSCWSSAALVFADADDYSTAYLKDEIFKFYNVDLTVIPHLDFVAYDVTDPTNPIHWKSFYYTSISVVVMSFQYAVMIYCGVFMYIEISNKTAQISPKLQKSHRQFFKALVFQITTPSAILFCPLVYIIIVPWLNLEIGAPMGIMVSMFTLYPALDAIIILYIVSDYSKIIQGFFQKSWIAVSSASTISSGVV